MCPVASKTPMKVSEVTSCREKNLPCARSWKTSRISARASNSHSGQLVAFWQGRAAGIGLCCHPAKEPGLPGEGGFPLCCDKMEGCDGSSLWSLLLCSPMLSVWVTWGEGAVPTMGRGKGLIRTGRVMKWSQRKWKLTQGERNDNGGGGAHLIWQRNWRGSQERRVQRGWDWTGAGERV